MLQPRFRLGESSLNDQSDTVDRIRDASDGIIRPPMVLSELDRFLAALGAQRYGMEDVNLCQMGKRAERNIRQLDALGERKRVLEMSRSRLEAARPELGDTELQQREGAQVIA